MNIYSPLTRDFMRPGRSPARAPRAMAATSNPLATETALHILRQGGNAIDAAIAACAVLCLTEPHQTGIGGDCFVLIAPKGTNKVIGYNGSGRAPAAIDRATVARRMPNGIEEESVEAVTVPGAVEAWARLSADHGRLPLAAVLEPAIHYAEQGVPIGDRTVDDWRRERTKIAASPFLAARFLDEAGEPLRPGTRICYPELARTFRRIAGQGADGFYRGPVAQAMVAALNVQGGVHRLSDFTNHRGEYVTPMSSEFRGYRVHQCPPNGQGIITLLLLGLVSDLPRDPEGPLGPWRAHSLMEAARLAFAMRDRHLCDPSFSNFDWQACLDAAALKRAAADIQRDARLPEESLLEWREHRDTTYLAVVDEERNAVSFINSLFEAFGSGIGDPETGVVFHNRGLSFSLDDAHPNALAPGKRPMHTIIPGMLTRNGRAVMPFGVMGGHFQPVGHTLLLSHMFDYGLDLQTAIDQPRLFPSEGKVWVESGIDDVLRAHLSRLGHEVDDRTDPIGGAQAIWIDEETGMLTGGSDPRKDGCAVGY
ncbi:gamma-glutamyltransferase family protein [Rhodoligotrophos ferricapiens]|uniref:gamma-glutamyltransferase family protein n=1 Tax=Rhodoligotrophos ferricapiens TaxID=3069264 RepID=UPI00315D9275